MAESKKTLEDIVEPQNIRFTEKIPNDYDDRTKHPYEWEDRDPAGFNATVVDFRYLGIKYQATDLTWLGFYIACPDCNRYYGITFTDKTIISKSNVVQDGSVFTFTIPVDSTLTDGRKFCKYIINELNKPEHKLFINHYQLYACKDEQFYIYDAQNHPFETGLTSIGKVIIGLKAVYKGQIVKPGTDYKKSDVEVSLVYSDNTTKIIDESDWTPSSLTISSYEVNTFIATYNKNQQIKSEYVIDCNISSGIQARYIGPDIPVQECYDTNDVEVVGISKGGYKILLSPEMLKWERNLRINDNGLLRKFVSYTDPSGQKFTAEYYVPGVPRPIGIKAQHMGFKKSKGSKVQKEEIKVIVTYLLNDFGEDNRKIEDRYAQKEEWKFVGTDVINDSNNGILKIEWEYETSPKYHFSFTTTVEVGFTDGTDAYLLAWYEGPEIEVGKTYDVRHVIVYLCKPGKDRIQLQYLDSGVIIDRDTLIKREGDNEYEVMYQYDRWLLRAKYIVVGVISKQYPDLDFKVIYIEKDTFKETDLTEDFRPYFTYQGGLTITWNQFMRRIYDYEQDKNPYFGMFRVDAPKRTGLWSKYASSWHVYVFNTKNLKAEIYKIYCDPIKEENKDGKNEENI